MSQAFILGAPRSGTTLLATLLDNHRGVYVSENARALGLVQAESELLKSIGPKGDVRRSPVERVVQALGRRNERYSRLFKHADVSSSDFRALIAAAAANQALAKGKQLWCDKEPNLIDHIPEISCLLPDSKLIHVIRDGRAVAASQRDRQYRDLYAAAHDWRRQLVVARFQGAYIGPERYREVRYERLLEDPETTLQGLCAFLEIEWDPEMLQLDRHADASDSQSYVGRKLDAGKSGGWRKKLSTKEQVRLEGLVGDMLIDLGYGLNHVDRRGPFRAHTPLQHLYRKQLAITRGLFRSERTVMKRRKLVKERQPLSKRVRRFVGRTTSLWVADSVLEAFRTHRRVP